MTGELSSLNSVTKINSDLKKKTGETSSLQKAYVEMYPACVRVIGDL